MKKLVFVLVLCLLLVGCGAKEKEKEKEIGTEGTINGYTYKITTGDDSKYKTRGYYVDTLNQPEAPWFYIIAMGEKNTGGYSISIKSMDIDKDGNAKIVVEEKKPDGPATMAFTYPYVIVQFDKYLKTVTITNTKGEEFLEVN